MRVRAKIKQLDACDCIIACASAQRLGDELDQVKASIHLPKMENKEEEEGKKEKEDNQKEEDKKEEQSLSSCRRSLMTSQVGLV